ncbi:MAG: sigma 54-interacting transcriptional regulator [Deltaproteobacteria bacterium]|nr:sigma 54-interacting transcriptional regulator [Deltaproteobacteria bacterium]
MPSSTDTGTRILSGDEPLRPSVQRFLLAVIRGPQPGSTHLLVGDRTVLGKGEDADVVIADATVSRLHLEIVRTGDRYALRDLGSTNGTFLEGTQIKEAFLKPGARIRAGEVLLRFLPVNEVVNVGPVDQKSFGDLLGTSVKTREAFALLHKIAPTEATILLLGETGTGKSAAARAIHASSSRRDGPFVVLDCGAISKSLIESELFGHEKGAFTGAAHTRQGAMEACRGGTLFIDELDDMPLEVQPKLLRALEEREIYRVGSHRPIHLDLRIIAATKKDLRKEVQEGRFREDLFFRISVVMIPIPPLRDRREDIPLLVDHFLGRPGAFDGLRSEIQDRLLAHTWPGNIRELRNVLERASYTGELDDFDPGTRRVTVEDPDSKLVVDHTRPFKEAKEALVSRFEREYLRQLLQRTKGNMAKAAREAGIDRKYLYMLQKKYGLGANEVPEE